MAKILITGSSGLIGSALTRSLRANAINVLGVDKRPAGSTDVEHLLVPNDPMIPDLLKDVTGVIHLAGVSRVVWGQRDPRECWDSNVHVTATLIEAILHLHPSPWLIYASSREVYGQGKTLPLADDAPIAPLNVYASSKAATEALIEQARKLRRLRAGILRFSTVFGGKEDHPDRVLPAFMLAAVSGAPLIVNGAEVAIDPTWIDDVIDGIERLRNALERNEIPERPILLATGQLVRLVDLASQICDCLRSESKILVNSPRTYDVERFAGEPLYAKNFLAWQPRTSLSAALKIYAEQFASPVA